MKYVLKDENNRTMLIKTNKDIGNVNDKNTLYLLLDSLYNNGIIDLDKKEDFEFGSLYIPRDDEYNFLTKIGFKVYNLEI